MGQQDHRVFLQEGGHGLDRGALGDEPQGQEAVAADGQFDRAGGQKGGDVGAGRAGQNLDVEAAPLIGPDRQRLIEAAMQGVGRSAGRHAQAHPAGLVGRRGRAAARRQRSHGAKAKGAGHQAASVQSISVQAGASHHA